MAQARERRQLPTEGDQPTWRRKLQAAYAHPAYADAKRALQRLARELPPLNESAARSLEEVLEETLTRHRLGVFPKLGVSFKTTNLLESVTARVEARTAKVDRWPTSDQKLLRCAAALGVLERQFRGEGVCASVLAPARAAATLPTPRDAAA